MILSKTAKQYYDVLNYLYYYFVKGDQGRGLFDDQMKNHLSTLRETDKRDKALSYNKSRPDNKFKSDQTQQFSSECT